ncbi:universal stress protein [Thermoleophilia bacterium SCSIO 60948]|nr:universal stress protein [Thermoleophilia bacterium SCSIO 60948]
MAWSARHDAEPIRFREVLCAVDASPQSLVAIRQAAALADPEARLSAVTVWDPAEAIHAGIHAAKVVGDLRRTAEATLDEACAAEPRLEPMLVRGSDVAGLLGAAAELDADLLAVGAHGASRLGGMLLGSVATAIVHHAPCCVLVARAGAHEFPGTIVHAGDGSADSMAAARVAGRIAGASGGSLVALHVGDAFKHSRELAAESAAMIAAGGPEPVPRAAAGSPHVGICAAARACEASLIVIGSRGMSGLRSFGSVSERVAHRARCSVLVVRAKKHARIEPGT